MRVGSRLIQTARGSLTRVLRLLEALFVMMRVLSFVLSVQMWVIALLLELS
ncbi:hypothetical protein LINPERHAP1_LOCUS38758 [Linum perenne]